MRIKELYTVGDLAIFLGREVIGDSSLVVTGINEIHRVKPGDLVFVDHPKYYDKAINSAASFILIDKAVDVPQGKALILSPAPFDDYNKLTVKFSVFRKQTSMLGENNRISTSAYLAPNCFIGNDVVIGDNVIIHPGVYIGDR